jgi:hypothetical protein
MEGDNGKLEQGGQNPLPGETKKVMVLTLYVEQPSGKVLIEGALGQQKLCLNVLGEAIKAVANFEVPGKIQLARPGMVQSVRQMFRKH